MSWVMVDDNIVNIEYQATVGKTCVSRGSPRGTGQGGSKRTVYMTLWILGDWVGPCPQPSVPKAYGPLPSSAPFSLGKVPFSVTVTLPSQTSPHLTSLTGSFSHNHSLRTSPKCWQKHDLPRAPKGIPNGEASIQRQQTPHSSATRKPGLGVSGPGGNSFQCVAGQTLGPLSQL